MLILTTIFTLKHLTASLSILLCQPYIKFSLHSSNYEKFLEEEKPKFMRNSYKVFYKPIVYIKFSYKLPSLFLTIVYAETLEKEKSKSIKIGYSTNCFFTHTPPLSPTSILVCNLIFKIFLGNRFRK